MIACTAADIMAQDLSCPASGSCTISSNFDVSDGCTLDFTGRALTLGRPEHRLRRRHHQRQLFHDAPWF